MKATLVLHLGGYDLKGFYSLEEYYARDLPSYYNAIAVGPSHNYYMGRAEADISAWIEYFCIGMADAFNYAQRRAKEAARAGKLDKSDLLKKLDVRQRKALALFNESEWITAAQIGKNLGLTARTARHLCQRWVEEDFLIIIDPAKKSRKYGLHASFSKLIS